MIRSRNPSPFGPLPGRSLLPLLSLLLLASSAFAGHPWITEYKDSTSCTRCHVDAARQVMATSHWTWEHKDPVTGQTLGKNNVINNYCIAVPSNEPRCTSCHVGVGYADKNFDFTDATKVDCLICHDTTGEYKKFPSGAGAPVTGAPKEFPAGSGKFWQPVDLLKVARSVGRTTRATCGACHFYGGGDDAVKHGDLDSSMANPDRELDVHMNTAGLNFQCGNCHRGDHHEIPGTRYSKNHTDDQMCQGCHTSAPHKATNPTLDSHTARVACQTCHIPAFARGSKSTKMSWDWSTAGQKDANGKNFVLRNAEGEAVYDTQKGTFRWERNVIPEYVWSNGGATYVTLDDTIEADAVIPINRLHGSIGDAKSKIFPVKRFSGVQPYDAGAKILAVPHLFPSGASDTSAYWKVFDWNKALDAGMTYIGRSYSGNLGWVKTEMFWIQNHMVAPKERALGCADCHAPRGRLDFAALGYPAERAARLQTMAGFELASVGLIAEPPQVRIRWNSAPGHMYQVQTSSDLAVWTDAPAGAIPAGDVTSELSWSGARTAGEPMRFFRVIRRSP